MALLRDQITSQLDDYKRANGKGSTAIANIAMTRIVEIFLDHIENQKNVPMDANQDDETAINENDRITDLKRSFEVANGLAKDKQVIHEAVPGNEDLKAVDKLHDSDYLMEPDYTAIMDHLENPPPVKNTPSPPVKDVSVKHVLEQKRRPGRPKRR